VRHELGAIPGDLLGRERLIERLEACGCRVQPGHESRDGLEQGIGEHPGFKLGPGDIPWKECQGVTALGIEAEKPRACGRSVDAEAISLEVVEVARHRPGLLLVRPSHGVADAHYADGDIAGGQLDDCFSTGVDVPPGAHAFGWIHGNRT